MKEKKEKQVKVHGTATFNIINIILYISFLISLCLSIVDNCRGIISWPVDYEDVICTSLQIITAIVSLVVSIVGIAISLQNEEFFGVKITKLYALRVEKHYSIRQIILASVFLCAINLATYMFGLTLAVIGITVISLVFLVQVVWMEIPIMAKDEKALLQILKDNFIDCYLNKKEASTDLKDSIRYLIYKKNFKELYEYFRDDFDDEYNQYVVMNLLEFQHDLAFNLPNKSIEEQKKISSSLLTNVLDIILHHIDLSEKTYSEIEKNLYLLTRILFRINDVSEEQNPLLERISGLIQCLTFSSNESKKIDDFVSSIIIILTSETVKNGDFRIIREIRKQFSQMDWGLKKECPALNVFAVISLQMYYLCCSERDVPEKLKSSIIEFINEKNIIEDNIKISSWKQLFTESAEEFNVEYDDFLKLVMKHENNLEYWLYGTGAKFVVISEMYVTRWYLTNLINREIFSEIKFNLISKNSEKIYPYIRTFGDACFDENRNFVPTEEMKRIINFYDESEDSFIYFKINEEHKHEFFNFVNKIKLEELKKEANLAEQIDSIEFSNNIKSSIEDALRKEWGFNEKIEINNPERHFSVLIEKIPEAINFADTIIDYCIRSVFADIKKDIQKTVVHKDDNFEEIIQAWISKKGKYITRGTKSTLPYFYIGDDSIKELFLTESLSWIEFDSKLLGMMAMVNENGFCFNCLVREVKFETLSEEELSKQLEKYQRQDGQYVFNGTFLPKEEIAKIIKDKFGILSVSICHQVISKEDDILEIKPHSAKDE